MPTSLLTLDSITGRFYEMKGLFISSINSPIEKTEAALWFVFRGQKMLIVMGESKSSPPLVRDIRDVGICPVREIYVGVLDGIHCYAAEVGESPNPPDDMEFHGLWALHGRLDETFFGVAFRAIHTIEWDRTDQYCSRCGSKNRFKNDERAKECTQCGYVSFPRISPAIIVLVEHDGKALLARSPRFKEGLFSTLAGFVEPGETLEEAVRREVKEEAGVDVKNIRYFGSQPWPFPDSLMIGFTAEYAGGEIEIDDNEILDARWFTAEDMPEIPGKISISRALIDNFLEKVHKKV
jgi:NAD+ diphosphatase